MSASTIRNIVTEALAQQNISHYASYAEPVIEALTEREDVVKDALRTYAVEKGVSNDEIDRLFIAVGLDDEPVVEEVADPDNQGDLSTVLAAIESLRQEIQAIKNAAARHGVRV